MSEKARGGLFNKLGDIEGLTILDAFAGTGALGYEALSRGAKSVTVIEIDRKAIDIIKINSNNLGLASSMKIVKSNAGSWSDNNLDQTFDIVIAAPPYDDLQLAVVIKMTRHVKKDGLFVLDWPPSEQVPDLSGFKQIAENNYGDAQLVFYS
jgi:16S rRNA (guanine966-N2)-methyltransferase